MTDHDSPIKHFVLWWAKNAKIISEADRLFLTISLTRPIITSTKCLGILWGVYFFFSFFFFLILLFYILNLKVPNKNCSRQHFIFLLFSF